MLLPWASTCSLSCRRLKEPGWHPSRPATCQVWVWEEERGGEERWVPVSKLVRTSTHRCLSDSSESRQAAELRGQTALLMHGAGLSKSSAYGVRHCIPQLVKNYARTLIRQRALHHTHHLFLSCILQAPLHHATPRQSIPQPLRELSENSTGTKSIFRHSRSAENTTWLMWFGGTCHLKRACIYLVTLDTDGNNWVSIVCRNWQRDTS